MAVALRHVLALALVAAATVVALVCRSWGMGPQALALVYVVPGTLAAALWGLGPALVAAAASALTLDYLFIPPFYTLEVASPSDIAAIVLLAIVAAIVSVVASGARRRALDARAAAERAEALRTLAHAVVHGDARATVFQTAAEALARIFSAPAVIIVGSGGALATAASAGGAAPTAYDLEAAQWVVGHGNHVQGGVYPFDRSRFDMWPAPMTANETIVLGVDFSLADQGRPARLEELVELVAGYLTAARPRGRGP